jgi:hypothetical protein
VLKPIAIAIVVVPITTASAIAALRRREIPIRQFSWLGRRVRDRVHAISVL